MVAREQCGQDATGSAALRSYPSRSTAIALRVWGMPDWLTATLGRDFSLGFEEGVVLTRFSSSAAAWDAYTEGFGPVRAVAQALDEAQRNELRTALVSWVDQFRTRARHQHTVSVSGDNRPPDLIQSLRASVSSRSNSDE